MELHSSDIERQITKLRQAITDTEAEHRELAFQYSETGKKDLMDRMMKLRETVSVYRYEVESNEAAKDEALRREAEQANEQATKGIFERVAQGKRLMDQRVAIAKKLETQFATIGKTMQEFLDISEQIRQHHQALFEQGIPQEFWGIRNFNKVPQQHGWKTALRSAGLSEFLKPNYHLPPGNHSGGAAMTLSEAIQKQHEMVRYRKKVSHIINSAAEVTSDE